MLKELDLPKKWLNDTFQGFIGDNFPVEDFAIIGNLLVNTVKPKCLVAMKINAARIESDDMADLIFLLRKLKIDSFDYCMSLVHKCIPADEIKAEAEYFFAICP
jgi:hypothetical protein